MVRLSKVDTTKTHPSLAPLLVFGRSATGPAVLSRLPDLGNQLCCIYTHHGTRISVVVTGALNPSAAQPWRLESGKRSAFYAVSWAQLSGQWLPAQRYYSQVYRATRHDCPVCCAPSRVCGEPFRPIRGSQRRPYRLRSPPLGHWLLRRPSRLLRRGTRNRHTYSRRRLRSRSRSGTRFRRG